MSERSFQICKVIYITTLVSVWPLFPQIYILFLNKSNFLLSYWNVNETNVRTFDIVPQVSEALFTFFKNLFSLDYVSSLSLNS